MSVQIVHSNYGQFAKRRCDIAGKIPRELIYNKDLGDKRVMFYLYVYFSVSRSGELCIITNEAIRSMGFRPDLHKGKINDEFTSFLLSLEQWGYIKVIQRRRWYTRYLALSKMEGSPFGLVRYNEYQRIIKSKGNRAAAFLILSFIRLNTYRRISESDTRPEIYFCHMHELSEKTGLPRRTVSYALKQLSAMCILHGEEQKRYLDKYGNWHSGVYLFIDKEKYINGSIDQSYNWHDEFESASMWLADEQARYNDWN